MHLHTQFLDLVTQHRAAVVVQLHRHQTRGELHHVGLQAQALEGVSRFQAQQATADHHAGLGAGGIGADGVQVVQGTVDKTVLVVLAVDGRHKRVGTGGQNQFVIGVVALGGGHAPVFAVNADHLLMQVQVDVVLGVPVSGAHGQVGVGGATEILGQMDTVIGELFFLTEHDDVVLRSCRGRHELLKEVVTHHAVADDDQVFGTHGSVLSQIPGAVSVCRTLEVFKWAIQAACSQ